jgi:hypothetical protein
VLDASLNFWLSGWSKMLVIPAESARVKRIGEFRRSRGSLRLYRHVGTPSAMSPPSHTTLGVVTPPRGYSSRAEARTLKPVKVNAPQQHLTQP